MIEAMENENCECPGFRRPVALFRISRATGEVEVVPDTLATETVDMVVERVLAANLSGSNSQGLLMLAGDPRGRELAVGYYLAEDLSDGIDAAFGFVVSLGALHELFEELYEDDSLLPQPVAGNQPNDSLLHVTIFGPQGQTAFASPTEFQTRLSATAPMDEELGGLTVRAAVRPDAASQLVIGGLPRSRLPLLSMLLLLTLGVGIASAVQLRREHAFQRLRDDFVSGVSHELRTPLAQIRMFAELQQAAKLSSASDQTRATFVIHRESVRLSHLVENILQFSRLQRMPEHHLPKERLDLAEAIADGVDAVTPLLEDRGMRLDVTAEPGVTIIANREALTRILVNLLDNAAKYGPSGQTVGVSVDRVNGSARLIVADEGPGIPAADRARVWKPYRRLERDVRGQIPGTGIGLSVVQELAALHGGRAWVEDAEPAGARFVLELPLATATDGAGESDPAIQV
jgi:signal transduction histidine kinase